MNKATRKRVRSCALIGALAVTLGGCGGGGGGGGGSVTPPPAPSSVTYTLEVSALSLTDQATGATVDEAGLPIAGATATRTP